MTETRNQLLSRKLREYALADAAGDKLTMYAIQDEMMPHGVDIHYLVQRAKSFKQKPARCQFCKWWGNAPADNSFNRQRVEIRPCVFGSWDGTQDMPKNGMAIPCLHDGPIYTGPEFGCVNFEQAES